MNDFIFVKFRLDPTIFFQNSIKIRKLTVIKSKSCLNPKSYHCW